MHPGIVIPSHMFKFSREDWPLYLIILGLLVLFLTEIISSINKPGTILSQQSTPGLYVAPSIYLDNELQGEEREKVIYGEELIANTTRYLGPHGSVMQITNGMNCQNCHLQAGKKTWGNNYSAVFSTYPKYRDRSGSIETIPKRVNDCIERSLNGKPLDSTSKEMQSIIAYMRWLGKGVKKGEKPAGVGINELPYLDRPADPEKGRLVYTSKCQTCHLANGQGQLKPNGIGYLYPPLWGEKSYNTGAGLFRLSRFAGFVKDNMPFDQATHYMPVLSVEEAWDVAAFVNSQPRPIKDLSSDWPDISKKPFDHPFGPYTDGFNEQQHKYGPFKPIIEARKKQKESKGLVALEKK